MNRQKELQDAVALINDILLDNKMQIDEYAGSVVICDLQENIIYQPSLCSLPVRDMSLIKLGE